MAKQNPTDMSGDILSQLMGTVNSSSNEQTRLLKSINDNIQDMIKNGGRMSQANAVNSYGKSSYAYRSSRYSSYGRGSSYTDDDVFDPNEIKDSIASEIARSLINSRGIEGMVKSVLSNITGPITTQIQKSSFDILDGIEHAIKSSILQFDFGERLRQILEDSAKTGLSSSTISQKLQKALSTLADDLGVDKKDIKKAIGRELGKKLLKNQDVKAVTDFWRQYLSGSLDDAKKAYESATKHGSGSQAINDAADAVAKAKKDLEDVQKVVAAKNELDSARKQVEDAQKAVNEANLSGSQSALEASQKRLEDAKKSLEETQKAFDVIRDSYESGRPIESKQKNPDDRIDTDSGESKVSSKQKQERKKSDTDGERISQAKNTSLSSQVCNITAQNATISVSGNSIEDLINRNVNSVTNDQTLEADTQKSDASDLLPIEQSSNDRTFTDTESSESDTTSKKKKRSEQSQDTDEFIVRPNVLSISAQLCEVIAQNANITISEKSIKDLIQIEQPSNDTNFTDTESSESDIASKKKKTSQQSEDANELVVNFNGLSLTSQVCNITTQHANIEVSGIDIEELLHSGGNKEDIVRQLKGENTEGTENSGSDQLDSLTDALLQNINDILQQDDISKKSEISESEKASKKKDNESEDRKKPSSDRKKPDQSSRADDISELSQIEYDSRVGEFMKTSSQKDIMKRLRDTYVSPSDEIASQLDAVEEQAEPDQSYKRKPSREKKLPPSMPNLVSGTEYEYGQMDTIDESIDTTQSPFWKYRTYQEAHRSNGTSMVDRILENGIDIYDDFSEQSEVDLSAVAKERSSVSDLELQTYQLQREQRQQEMDAMPLVDESQISGSAKLSTINEEQKREDDVLNKDLATKQLAYEEAQKELADSKAAAATDGVINVFKLFTGQAETLLKSNSLTGKLYDTATKAGKSEFGSIKSQISQAYKSGSSKYKEEIASGFDEVTGAFDIAKLDPTKMSGMNGMIATLTGGATDAGAAMSGLTNVITSLGPEALLTVGAFKLVTGILKKGFAPAVEGFKKTIDAADTALNRYHLSQKKNIENAQKRLLEDINTLVSTPFDILKKGAEEWYSAWDNNLRTITATQGYTKSDLQDLMAAFADRLRSEGLTSVVSATDITNNLTKVLQSGLSGEVAEEFAYIATKLNAAVPTQDFFSYADTYASIAANAIRTGMEQADAIEYANQQLTAFANNVLYASREVAGGFTTGLKNAESLFKQSVQISQTGKTYNASEISGVLTAVSAITGAIAPDLATAMTDAIYKAAVGGNSSEVVALRSLAGVNASNTDFLKELTSNPKAVFSELFTELAKRQNMSEDAYMEVAEGLSSIFGLSAESFARVDFGYLAQAIESMDTSSKALTDNMTLLRSGETTTNAEQMKMQQINKMILDEGLSYVLDNEAARSIQEHMWNEQLARELQETEYGVNLHGAALELLEGIRTAVDTITTILNPVKLIGKIASLFSTSKEDDALQADVASILEAGKVGQGNARAKYNLTTYRADLQVVDDLNTMFGTTSSFKKQNAITNALDHSSAWYPGLTLESGNEAYSGKETKTDNKTPESRVRWATVGKSIAYEIMNSKKTEYELLGIEGVQKTNAQNNEAQVASVASSQNLQKMLDSMESYVRSNESATYEDWMNTARSFGIADYGQVVKDSSLTEDQIKNQYALLQAQLGLNQQKQREQNEEKYWSDTTQSLTKVEENTSKSSDSVGIVAQTAEQISGSLSVIQTTYLSVDTKVGSIDTKVGEINTKAGEINTKMDTVIQSIKDLGSGSLDPEFIKTAVEDIRSYTGSILSGMYQQDNNREHPEDNTYSDLTVAGWLQFIYNHLFDKLTPTVEKIERNTEELDIESSSENSYSSQVFDSEPIIYKLEQIVALLRANNTSFVGPMPNSFNGNFY